MSSLSCWTTPSREPPGDGETRRQATSVAVAAPASFEVVIVEGRDAGARALLDVSSTRLTREELDRMADMIETAKKEGK